MRNSRYTSSMFRSLGLTDEFNNSPDMPMASPEQIAKDELFAYGNYKELIQTLFKDGFSYGDLHKIVTQSSDQGVVTFVNNFLFKSLPKLPGYPTDEDAFNSIIPRSVQTEAELRPYLDNLKQFISDYRSEHEENSEPSKPDQS